VTSHFQAKKREGNGREKDRKERDGRKLSPTFPGYSLAYKKQE